jgi:catechol 2,3-dioxygenase-like lactoylglutathione lyase family enzyme
MNRLHAVTFLVRDYDDAMTWFREKLNFIVLENTPLSPGKRWVLIAPPDPSTAFLLAKADNDEQRRSVGKAAGGRVAYFLHTDDFEAAHSRMKTAGVKFKEEPRKENYGSVAVFEDLYGNAWDLIQPVLPKQ